MSYPTRFTYTVDTEEFTAAQRLTSAQLPTARLRAILNAFNGLIHPALSLSLTDLRDAPFRLSEKQAERVIEAAKSPLPKDFEKTASIPGISVLTWHDPAYPASLLPFDDSPPLLFVRGEIPVEPAPMVSIVGSRRSTSYGRKQAERFSRTLVENRVIIVSGGASGIDTVAHTSALDAGGKTIAVLGCGVDHTYPAENRALFARITEGNGAIVSEYPIGTTPEPWRFPARNRIIAGLAKVTIVIESPSDSGALITARCAAEYGRSVFAVPGEVDSGRSRGCHDLIRDGAFIADNPEDVLLTLGITQAVTKIPLPAVKVARKSSSEGSEIQATATPVVVTVPSSISLTPDEEQLLTQISSQPRHLDEMATAAGLSAAQSGVAATLLEMKALIRRLPGNLFVRSA